MNKKPYYVMAFSGGKDSTYLLYEILKRGLPLDEVVFYDTGLEFPITYAWLDEIEKRFNIKINRYSPRPGRTFHELFFRVKKTGRYAGEIRGFPYKCVRGCWVSRDCKIGNRKPRPGEKVYIGLAYNERARASVNAERDGKIYPLIEWKIDEKTVINRLKDLNLYPPYYAQGFTRGGCWLCPKQPLKSLRLLWELYPELWEKLKFYQKQQARGFRDDYTVFELETKFKREYAGNPE